MRGRTGPVLLAAALLLLPSGDITAAEERALERDIVGFFVPHPQARGTFAEVSELHLAGRGEYGWAASPPYCGMLKTAGRSGRTYPLRQPAIDGLKIRFITQSVGGVSYEFAGRLGRADFSGGGIPIEQTMLEGTMRKWKDGRPIASARMQFYFEAGG